MHAADKNANTLHAQASPRDPYKLGLIKGKIAATIDRVTTVEAIALAHQIPYVSIMYCVRPWMITALASPKGTPESTGTIQGIGGLLVLRETRLGDAERVMH